MRLEDLQLIYCLTCTFVAVEDIASNESEVDAEGKETGLEENPDFTTVSVTSLFNTSWKETVDKYMHLQSVFKNVAFPQTWE